ncbi:helix-turn-helix domain-containing protein [Paenibacillus qinlingensis]|uniref:TetR/AcrR family transcriptional repressor of nem operon n=1 Tax=Paenibacillus qinlingensis TaxID=1837343 RepID=A0ABU1P545_9BACL|nr:helix-turn-helix domain-containing protein [Paenibacillus qinlingensis]MDR6554848.1 TetR/AcrR family transcriptional repressor of nem operon [Paenibacillus qinlingensis]
MARPKEFDQEAALDKALELFWEKGYERTSIQDLVEHTGVHRGSLYDTFGDKQKLFLTCLDHSRMVAKERTFHILEEEGEPKEVLQRFFTKLIDLSLEDEKQRRGCFVANTAMNIGNSDPVISLRVEAYMIDMETSFYHFLIRAQQKGALKSKHGIRELARFLLSTRNGLLVLAKTATDRKVLEDAVAVAMSIFM